MTKVKKETSSQKKQSHYLNIIKKCETMKKTF